MIKKYCCFLTLLSIFNVPVKSTVIVPNHKRVLAAAEASGPRLLYVTESGELLQSASSSYRATGEFEAGSDTLAVDYHYPADLLVWSTRAGRLYGCGLAESRGLAYVRGPRLLRADDRWLPASLAVDHLADRLYVLDTRANVIHVLEIRGTGGRLLVRVPRGNGYRPALLELDPAEGLAFLMDHGQVGKSSVDHILRMNMDGSEARIIDPPSLTKESIIGKMTIDRINKMILVSSITQRKIFSMDYNGQVLRTILAQNPGAISLSVTRNELFWVNAFYYRQGTAHVDGSAYRCAYDPELGCKANTTERLPESGVILALRAVEPASQITPSPSGMHCRDGADCGQQCVALAGGPACACEVGWRLEDNLTDCRRIREFLIYEDGGVVRGACLRANCQPILPFPADLKFKPNERTGFDYDSTTGRLYYGGKESIYQADLETGAKTQLLHQRGVFFGPLAVDWVSKNLYYTEIEQRGNVSFYIMKVMSARTGEPTRAQASSSLLWEFGRVHSIAVHPNRGYLFVSVFNNGKRQHQLLRLHADTRNVTFLPNLGEVSFMSIDYREDRLYVLDANSSDVTSSDLEGRDARKIGSARSLAAPITGFLVHGNAVYATNRSRLIGLDKVSGEELRDLPDIFPYDQRMSAGLRLHSSEALKTPGGPSNPCAEDNGACDNFCFAVPRAGDPGRLTKLCRCFDGVKCTGYQRSG